jgi:hypothetical protein
VKLWLVGLILSLLLSGAAEAADKNKTVRITNRQGTQAQVYINFAADSVLKSTDVPFCKVTGPLNCEFTLAANSSLGHPESPSQVSQHSFGLQRSGHLRIDQGRSLGQQSELV